MLAKKRTNLKKQRFKQLKVFCEVTSAKFSSDGKKIVSSSGDGTVQIWDVKTGTRYKYAKLFIFCSYGTIFIRWPVLSCSRSNKIRLWHAKSGQEITIGGTFMEYNKCRIFIRQSNDSINFIGSNHSIVARQVWTRVKKIERTFPWSEDVNFSPDGKTIVSTSYDYTIGIWNIESGKTLHELKKHSKMSERAHFKEKKYSFVRWQFHHISSQDTTIRLWG
ncbi:WD repeat-containing protein [Reticulomyxa filosa]|uniref:WD repeat-containing protein n=1 Tax=Reticulomyxa filosa TaxID=46433 RepID=X6MTY2_RETFI|nr:WD repeat-containing protein [Reticulomyxa filosa]|eukprot:ETO17299.1 WD repeat-containing protein [Reticulomyxa filosa]